ncbi:MAG: 16S rRNA (cytosine(967)-C(5))-methyltransferase RsmB [Deltaproteobacteria bacterium]|nr:16S rRNA (cytosine(967)-C(5))-methyltransferase RsmB [Deltaproteobacteria bacterium]
MINARTLAFQILLHLDRKASHPDRLIRGAMGRHVQLDDRERALLTELVYGVVRWQGRLDWHIDQLSRVKPERIASSVRILLRLALYQILFLDRIPAHAAVNEAVKMTRATHPPYLAGFVNGILREAIRTGKEWKWPSMAKHPVEYLAVATSHPLWMVRRFLKEMGFDEAFAFCSANNQVAPLVLRANTLKVTADRLAEKLEREGIHSEPSPHLPHALRVKGVRTDPFALGSFREGWFQVQDEASQLVSLLLDPTPGDRVLDLCAGFGAKTTHMAALMENRGRIVAVDEAAWKLDELTENAARQGVGIVDVHGGDVLQTHPEDLGFFDHVLLDAPCSGLGTLRRNPDIRWRRHVKDPQRFSRLQQDLIRQAARFVKAKGVLVYATCTIFSEENETVVDRFLQTHPAWELEPAEQVLPEACRSLCQGGFLRTWPHRNDVDGFFGARFRRNP